MKPDSSPPVAAHEERPSKTQLKKASHELQALGEDLLRLPDARLQAVPMPPPLLKALQELKRTRSHEGRRRQLQYVGKLMRGVDAQPLRDAGAAPQMVPARETFALHEAERWRDRLLATDDALTPWLAAHPQTDAQALRTLIRNARREAAAVLPADAGGRGQAPRKGRVYRDLFRALSDQLRAGQPDAAAAPDDPDDPEDPE